jgi:menaquinone-dependent protoporphyrinogen oxidase
VKLLFVYGTAEGHTRTIVERMADVANLNNAEVEVFDSAALTRPLANPSWDGIIVGGSVHQGQHQMALRAFVLDNLALLNEVPSAFFSVSLSAAVKEASHQEEARCYLTTFLNDVAWQPVLTECFAGALKHSEYDYFRRMVLSLLARQLEPGIVQAQDVSYTDWAAVDAFVKDFMRRVAGPLVLSR